MKIIGWEKKEIRIRRSGMKRRWTHKTLQKSGVMITQAHPTFDYEITIRQLSKREKREGFSTIPKGTIELLQIGRAKTIEAAEKKAIKWMKEHPNG